MHRNGRRGIVRKIMMNSGKIWPKWKLNFKIEWYKYIVQNVLKGTKCCVMVLSERVMLGSEI